MMIGSLIGHLVFGLLVGLLVSMQEHKKVNSSTNHKYELSLKSILH